MFSYDEIKGLLQLERKDGQRFSVPANLFSKDDQTYIMNWVKANRVLSEKNLRISFKKKKGESYKDEKSNRASVSGTAVADGEKIYYEITLSNRSKEPIVGLKVESRFFVSTEKDDKEEMKAETPNSITISLIKPGKSVTIKTAEVTIEDIFNRTAVYGIGIRGSGNEITGYNKKKVSSDDLVGLWVRVYGPDVDGEPVIRNMCEPRDLADDLNWDGETQPK